MCRLLQPMRAICLTAIALMTGLLIPLVPQSAPRLYAACPEPDWHAPTNDTVENEPATVASETATSPPDPFPIDPSLAATALQVRPNGNDRICVVPQPAAARRQLQIKTADGKLSCRDLVCGIARLNGYDDRPLSEILPEGQISVNSGPVRWTMQQFNEWMSPCLRCEWGEDESVTSAETETQLSLTLDRRASRDWTRGKKAGLRRFCDRFCNWFDWPSEPTNYGLQFISSPPARGQDVVVMLHGLNSRPEDLRTLWRAVDQSRFALAVLRYPNDQPILESADLLSQELERFCDQYPHSDVRLVSHSMGGLVARAAIELPQRDLPCVKQLIMIAPPNHGSMLASVANFMDCYEFFTSAERRRAGLWIESMRDGLGEAATDLVPGSVFLEQLNLCPRASGVRYTILAGHRGPMRLAEIEWLRGGVHRVADCNRLLEFTTSKLARSLDELDEVVHGAGDGAVSLQRARLVGVTDFVSLPFAHGSVLNSNDGCTPRVCEIIQQRLAMIP